MDRRYGKKGLALIGAEVQGSDTGDIKKIIKDHKIKFPITKGAKGPISVSGIPHMVVFDTKGRLVFDGHPANPEAEKVIKKALKGAKPDEAGTASLAGGLFDRRELIAERTWKDGNGRELKASLTKLNGNTGTFRRPNGRTFEYDITKLSDADQKVIADATATEKESFDR